MNVFVMPHNTASIVANTVAALNSLPGVHARGFTLWNNKYRARDDDVRSYGAFAMRKSPVRWAVSEAERWRYFRSSVTWADVIHWVYDDFGLREPERRFLARVGKPSVIEWTGSDVRDPDFVFSVNPYYTAAWTRGYEYAAYESHATSRANQEKFKAYGALPLVSPEIDLFVDRELFPERVPVWPRLELGEVRRGSLSPRARPVVAHAPSATVAKGTDLLLPVVENLKREIDFDFVLLHDLPRDEVLRRIADADVFIDQLVLGMYGMASYEAMLLGKPVLCYLMPPVLASPMLRECPIVNVTVESLSESLRALLADAPRRHKLGEAGRRWAEERCSFASAGDVLVHAYRAAIAGAPRGTPQRRA
jgi:hypothetical protein